MRTLLFVVASVLLGAACGDNLAALPADAGPPDSAVGLDAEAPDASSAAAPCLDRAADLASPPAGRLPCDLLPPGFGQ